MNTTKKGNKFEKKVYSHLKHELDKGFLHVSGKNSIICRKKKYYSRDRDSDIVTDISIETYIRGAKDYSLLTVIECKDYAHNVPVDDIEEFHSKVQQISGLKTKAIFVTTAALQKGALKYAQSKGIAVIRFLPDDQVRHVLYCLRRPTFIESLIRKGISDVYSFYTKFGGLFKSDGDLSTSEFSSAFLNSKHVGVNRKCYAFYGRVLFDDSRSLLKSILIDSV